MRIATRGSALALAQAQAVADMLGGAELVALTTAGDRDATADGQDKGRWVHALEAALAAGDVDLAVHSAKDVPAEMPAGLSIVGSPLRADPRDALCGANALEELPAGARVGTSSLRRSALLRALREDLDVVELRGNVDTRLRHLDAGEYEAIILALAGLTRLGRSDAGVALDPKRFVPAAGQGTLALQARSGDSTVRDRVRAIADPATESCLAAERAMVRALEADCDTPVGAYATLTDKTLTLDAFLGKPDGSAWIRDRVCGEEPQRLGEHAAQRLRAAGAEELLGR